MAKQLSLSDRIFIENSIHRNYTFASIARQLGRSPSAISREGKRYRVFVDKPHRKGENNCVRFRTCVRNNLCEEAPTHDCYFYRCKSCPDKSGIPICPAYVSSQYALAVPCRKPARRIMPTIPLTVQTQSISATWRNPTRASERPRKRFCR